MSDPRTTALECGGIGGLSLFAQVALDVNGILVALIGYTAYWAFRSTERWITKRLAVQAMQEKLEAEQAAKAKAEVENKHLRDRLSHLESELAVSKGRYERLVDGGMP